VCVCVCVCQLLVERKSFAVDSLRTDTRHVTREYSLLALTN